MEEKIKYLNEFLRHSTKKVLAYLNNRKSHPTLEEVMKQQERNSKDKCLNTKPSQAEISKKITEEMVANLNNPNKKQTI